jgi:hypothetical protein
MIEMDARTVFVIGALGVIGLMFWGAFYDNAAYEQARGAAFVACVNQGGSFVNGWGRKYDCKLPERR